MLTWLHIYVSCSTATPNCSFKAGGHLSEIIRLLKGAQGKITGFIIYKYLISVSLPENEKRESGSLPWRRPYSTATFYTCKKTRCCNVQWLSVALTWSSPLASRFCYPEKCFLSFSRLQTFLLKPHRWLCVKTLSEILALACLAPTTKDT